MQWKKNMGKHTILRITYILAPPISELSNPLLIWALNFFMEQTCPLEIVSSINDKVSTLWIQLQNKCLTNTIGILYSNYALIHNNKALSQTLIIRTFLKLLYFSPG